MKTGKQYRSLGFSIRTQMLLMTLAIGIPLAAMLVWSVGMNLRLAREKTELTVRRLAEQTATNIGTMLRDHQDVMSALALQPSVRTLDPLKLGATIVEVIRVHPEFNNLGLRKVNGENIFSNQPKPSSPQVAATFPWFQEGIRNDGFTAGDAFFGRLVNRWVSVLTFPVRDDAGRISGFLNMPLDLERFNQRLFPQNLPHAVITVVDRSGVILLRSTDAARFVGQHVPSTWPASRPADDGLIAATGLDGVQRLAARVVIPGVGWEVAAGVPTDEAYAEYYELRRRAILLGLAAATVALVLAWRIGAGIVRPSLALAEVASRVAAGDGSVRALPAGPAEVALVAQQFNRMLDAVDDNAAFNRAILDSVNAGIAVLDRDGVIVAVNETWRRFASDNGAGTGDPAPNTGIGSNYLAVCQASSVDNGAPGDPKVATEAERGIRAVLTGDLPSFSMEYPCDSPHQDRWFIVNVTPLKGARAGAVVSHIDITARVRFEQQQREQQALELARDKAESANRAKSAFLANMTHEIRTPMNAILGLIHLLRRAGTTPEQAGRLDRIASAGQHLMSIINDILDLSKIDAGQLQLESTDFHVATVLDHVSSIITESAHHKGIEVRVQNDGVPLWLRGDQTRLRQVLLNFAGNAVKFTQSGSIVLRAQCVDSSGDEFLVRFSVEDTGIGIPTEELSRLFQPFEQLDASTTRRFGGTGLGLAINFRLAQLMGGECGVESEPGRGSVFWFKARLRHGLGADTGRSADGLPEGLAEIEAGLRRDFQGARVLLVEDNEVNLEVAFQILRGLDLAVDTAVDGNLAVTMAGAGDYDLILMDMQMPDMDGLTATRAIRTLAAPAGVVPIVALTANAFEDDRRACESSGMNDFVAKPLDLEVLYAVLRKWLPAAQGSQTRRPDEAPPALQASAGREKDAAQAPDARVAGGDAVARPAALNVLAKLPGFDLAQGLASLRGDADKYLSILSRFIGSRVDDMHALGASLAAGDQLTARRQAHALYGSAATLGAQRLAELALGLESLLRESRSTTPASLSASDRVAAIEQEYLALAQALPSIAPTHTTSATPADPLDANVAREHLDALLARNDIEAIEYFRMHAAVITAKLGVAGGELGLLIEGFEFEAARHVLRAMS